MFICSLTSWRARINIVANTINSLLNQTFKPDKIVLTLSKEEFPAMDAELPPALIQLALHSPLEIYWVEGNSKAFKKLIPTLDRYRDAIVMTNDDDIIYPVDFLEEVTSHYDFVNPLTLNGGKNWGSGYGSMYEYRHFGKYLHAFDRKEVWRTNEDDIAYGVLMLLNGYIFSHYGYPFWQKIHQVDENHGLCANHQYDSGYNERWFEGYIRRRYNVDYKWLRDSIQRGIRFDLQDKEPISQDTLLQIHLRPNGVGPIITEDNFRPTSVEEAQKARLVVEKPQLHTVEVLSPVLSGPDAAQSPVIEEVLSPVVPEAVARRDEKKRKFLGEVRHIAESKGKKTFKKFINRH